MDLFSTRSQMTSKCGRKKKGSKQPGTTFLWCSVIYYCTDLWEHGIYFFYISKEQNVGNGDISLHLFFNSS